MKEKIEKFESLINRMTDLLPDQSIHGFEVRPSAGKWSKKEVLGHLVDSAINNIQRFTEIQFAEKPYKIRRYDPDALVMANDYQNKNNPELYSLLIQLNRHILHLAKSQTAQALQYRLILPNDETADLQFLIEDYFEHFYHHVNQINPEWI